MLKYRIYRGVDMNGARWFWHAKSQENGKIVGQGHTRGYRRRIDAVRAVELFRNSADAPVEIIAD